MCLVLCFSEDFPPNQFYFTVPLPLSVSPSVRENRWDGHNVGSVSGTEHRHLLWQEEDPQWYALIFHSGFLQWPCKHVFFVCVCCFSFQESVCVTIVGQAVSWMMLGKLIVVSFQKVWHLKKKKKSNSSRIEIFAHSKTCSSCKYKIWPKMILYIS